MATPFPSFTKVWHSTSYSAISPTRPELSTKGKTVLISGGGSGIGASIAKSFAAAGSTEIAILGRRENVLKETAEAIETQYPGTKVLAIVADVTKPDTLEAAFTKTIKAFGKVDICISNAGYLANLGPLTEADGDDWWKGFEINVKGSFNLSRAFLKHAKSGSVLLSVNTGVSHMPAVAPGHSSYLASKAAELRMQEYFASENPEIHVVGMHPGVIATDMSVKSGFPALDDVSLPADFSVWLVSDQAKFLRGKLAWSNWDVEELLARKEEISQDPLLLTMGLVGVSFENWSLNNIGEYLAQKGGQ